MSNQSLIYLTRLSVDTRDFRTEQKFANSLQACFVCNVICICSVIDYVYIYCKCSGRTADLLLVQNWHCCDNSICFINWIIVFVLVLYTALVDIQKVWLNHCRYYHVTWLHIAINNHPPSLNNVFSTKVKHCVLRGSFSFFGAFLHYYKSWLPNKIETLVWHIDLS